MASRAPNWYPALDVGHRERLRALRCQAAAVNASPADLAALRQERRRVARSLVAEAGRLLARAERAPAGEAERLLDRAERIVAVLEKTRR